MKRIKGEQLHVRLSASQTRQRLKGLGYGVRKVSSDGRKRAIIIHTATGQHRRELETLFQDVIETAPEKDRARQPPPRKRP